MIVTSVSKQTTTNIQARKRAPLYIYAFHFFQERIRRHKWRSALARLIAKTRPNSKGRHLQHLVPSDLQTLQSEGFTMLDRLVDEEWVVRVREELKKRSCKDRWRSELGSFMHTEVPSVTHVADINNVLQIPEVLEIANHPRVLSVVEEYLGCKPTIDSIKAWWSLPGHDVAENEQFYHRDNDSIRFLKLFIYLTDVNYDCGPHVFMRGTQAKDGCYERKRYQDEEAYSAFGKENEQRFTGKAGTAFLEDTYGLHKGALPTKHRRLLIQIRYSTINTIFMNRSEFIKLKNPNEANKYDKHINRNYIKI